MGWGRETHRSHSSLKVVPIVQASKTRLLLNKCQKTPLCTESPEGGAMRVVWGLHLCPGSPFVPGVPQRKSLKANKLHAQRHSISGLFQRENVVQHSRMIR